MQPITEPQRRPAFLGHWTWRLIGAATAAALAVLLATVVVQAGNHPVTPQVNTVTRTVTVPETVTSVSVTSDGGDIRVTPGRTSHVTVTEQFAYLASERPPGVTAHVAHGRLALVPSCQFGYCSVYFTVSVPARVAVTAASGGGAITVRGIGNASLDSGGGPVTASDLSGPLLVNSENGPITVAGAGQADLRSEGGPVIARDIGGALNAETDAGPLEVSGVAGLLTASTGGGTVNADGITAKTVQVSTDGGSAALHFSSAPQTVILDAGMGSALLQLPGGPYAVVNDGGPAEISVPTNPAATRTITVSGSDSLRITAAPGK